MNVVQVHVQIGIQGEEAVGCRYYRAKLPPSLYVNFVDMA